jgi:hypothetical protein
MAYSLEATVDVLLGLVQVLNATCGFEQDVPHQWSTLWPEVPDLPGFINVPTKLVGKDTSTDLWILIICDFLLLNGLHYLFTKWASLKEKPVVLVGRLGHDDVVSVASDGFPVLHDWL